MSAIIIILLTVLITIFLIGFAFKIAIDYIRKFLKVAIEVACYVNTFYYKKSSWDRVEIGKEAYYRAIFGNKENRFKKDKTDYIFWYLYSNAFNKLLRCIPTEINSYKNRSLSDGENVNLEEYVERYQKFQEEDYMKYASKEEKDIFNAKIENVEK